MGMVSGIRGTSETSLDEAFQDFAQKIVRREQQHRGLDDELTEDQKGELAEYFNGNFVPVRIEIELQPHNQWVKTFSVVGGG
jgi:hypothetical protein